MRIILFLCLGLCAQSIALAQKLVTYSINERDTSLYRPTEYEFKKLNIRSTQLGLYSIINKLSAENTSEMYILRFSHRHNHIFIMIQNWEYRGIDSIADGSIYGIFRFKDNKDFLICYDGLNELGYLKKYFSITKEKIRISIRIKTIPNNMYILSSAPTTYYKGVIVHKKLKMIKLIINNKLIYNLDEPMRD